MAGSLHCCQSLLATPSTFFLFSSCTLELPQSCLPPVAFPGGCVSGRVEGKILFLKEFLALKSPPKQEQAQDAGCYHNSVVLGLLATSSKNEKQERFESERRHLPPLPRLIGTSFCLQETPSQLSGAKKKFSEPSGRKIFI